MFKSFFMGGFECATHRRRDRTQIDVIAATHHDLYAFEDYQLLQRCGIFTVRDGLRWHLIEQTPGQYDWQSLLPQLDASLRTGTQVIWDLCHWGVPTHLDIFSQEFIDSFARFASAAAAFLAERSPTPPFYCPINEISFWAWVGGDVETFYPHQTGRGPELKRQLVAASLAARQAILAVDALARFVQAEPIIHITAANADDLSAVARHNESQYEVLDMLRDGVSSSTLSPAMPDIVGVNYYWNNQWIHNGERTPPGHLDHRPLHRMLLDLWERYHRPLLITETGTETSASLGWFAYVNAEVREAQRQGAEIVGICLYPVTDYPGWDDERHCPCGPIEIDPSWTQRSLRESLARELWLQTSLNERQNSLANPG